jgi:putative membrane protein insertion efficiency factor
LWLLVFAAIGLSSPIALAKDQSKAERLKGLMKPAPKTNYKNYLHKSHNEIQGTATVLFLSYKTFLSSQDMNSCVFTPSCSVYAIESLQKDNPVKAYLKIFDRLSRCHPFTKKGEYPYHDNNLLYDPAK